METTPEQIEIWDKLGTQHIFVGVRVTEITCYDDPGDDSRGYADRLYRLSDGKFRVWTEYWSFRPDEEDLNYSYVSEPLSSDNLSEQFPALAAGAIPAKETGMNANPLCNKVRLQQAARENQLILATPHGLVDMANTATVWGEGPNIYGFRPGNGYLEKFAKSRSEMLQFLRGMLNPEVAEQFIQKAEAWIASL